MFNEYAEEVFISHLEKQLQGTARLDVVRDTYIQPWEFKGINLWKEKKKGTQKGVWRNQAARELDGLSLRFTKQDWTV